MKSWPSVEFFGDEIEKLSTLHPVTGEVVTEDREIYLFPASHYVAGPERMERAIAGIEVELADRLAELERQQRLLEAQRLRMRTSYDVEMMRQIGPVRASRTTRDTLMAGPRQPAELPARLLPVRLSPGHR